MRIDKFSAIQNLYNVSKAPAKTESKGVPSFKDKLQISDNGKDLQVAKQAVAQAPDIREDRVAAIKSAYESGMYDVSAGAFAEKVMAGFAATL